MRTILHILTRPEDELTRTMIERQRTRPQTKVEVISLTGDSPEYDLLVEQLFAADSIEVC